MLSLVQNNDAIEGQELTVSFETESYNHRRFSAPWIACVEFDEVGSSTFKFGNFVGEHGCEGLLVLKTKVGGVIAKGQKDYRGNRTDVSFYIVRGKDDFEKVTKSAAFKYVSNK